MSVVCVRIPPVLLMAAIKPTNFKNDTIFAECVETHMGERFITIIHPKLTSYDVKSAKIFSPHVGVSFASWLIRASEWVADSKKWTKEIKIQEKRKKNKSKKEQTCQAK